MKQIILRALFIAALYLPFAESVAEPLWWRIHGVTNENLASDSSVATVGQAKHVIAAAKRHLDIALSEQGGAGGSINQILGAPWFVDSSNNYRVLLIGELKSMVQPFYDRINEFRATDPAFNTLDMVPGDASYYPWQVPATDANVNNALVTLGQLKFVFSFDLL